MTPTFSNYLIGPLIERFSTRYLERGIEMNTITNHPKKKMTLRARLFSKLVYVAIGLIFSAPLAVSQVPPTSVVQSSGVMPKDYFHTGAGAHYLRRAEGDIVTQSLRGNISVLMGSGANIIVLSGTVGSFWLMLESAYRKLK